MAKFRYLWSNRIRVNFFDKRFVIIWAKRILTLRDLISRDIKRACLVREGATISSTAEVGGAQFNGKLHNLIIGDNSFIGKAKITLLDKVTIGNNVCINDGVVILTASHDLNDPEWKHKKAAIQIMNYVWIGTRSMVLPGVTVGYGAIIAASATVTKDIVERTIVAGVPAKQIGERHNEFNYILNYSRKFQ